MDIRKTFLEYFQKKDHLIMPSSSLIPSDDPSVLLTTAGMQQFKPYYLGTRKPPKSRIATVQKCFRTSDIERVGYTDQHLTFFEMLGNFAFADYFKKEAISYAMDFILNVLNLPIEKLSVGVFAGDEDIAADKEAVSLWRQYGIDDSRIYKYGKSENFWGPAGETGPCGPCTELYFDFGPEFGCGSNQCSPSCSCGRFLEIWNLVFTQYNFNGADYEELPNKNIDTGMGMERISAVLAGNPSVFNTALFRQIVLKIEQLSGHTLLLRNEAGYNSDISRCIKIIADHARAVTFLIADGVLPSNESRGYILRRIIRRAVRFAKLINIEEVFLNQLAGTVIKEYSGCYSELEEKKDIIFKTIEDEENKFHKTLKEGNKVLSQIISDLKAENKKYIVPKDAFRLYETFGFPLELTTEILNENGLMLDNEKFNGYMRIHSEKSREKTAFNKKIDMNLDLYKKIAEKVEVEFTGYCQFSSDAIVKGILKLNEDGSLSQVSVLCTGDRGEIILDSSPFYGEKGGAVGDRGILKSNGSVFIVEDTQIPLEGLIVHRGVVKEGGFGIDDNISAVVDETFRKNISRNHTATHMLHWALRTLYGKEIQQAGSFVAEDRFRFDYQTNKVLSPEEFEKMERLINERIQKNDLVRCFETTLEYAKEIGATALFEEKYSKFVRVVEIDNYSRELCGGIHVSRTGEIGLLKIISDSSIGQNIRRIEAVTGMSAFNFLNSANSKLRLVLHEVESDSASVIEKIRNIKDTSKKLQEEMALMQIKAVKQEILNSENIHSLDGIDVIFFDFTKSKFNYSIDSKMMGVVGDELINSYSKKDIFLLFQNIINDKPVILLQCSRQLTIRGINCAQAAKDLSKVIKGGGGGKPEFAQIGGFDIKLAPEAPVFIIEYIKNNIKK